LDRLILNTDILEDTDYLPIFRISTDNPVNILGIWISKRPKWILSEI
jgi:hypothetical protein